MAVPFYRQRSPPQEAVQAVTHDPYHITQHQCTVDIDSDSIYQIPLMGRQVFSRMKVLMCDCCNALSSVWYV